MKIFSNKETKKEVINWAIFISVALFLYFSGLYRPLISGVQRVILSTGIIQPDTDKKPLDASGPVSMKLMNERGEVVNLADLRGKVVFVNFWATWCPPCKAEMPGIQELYEEVKSDDIVFVMLSRDREFQKAIDFKHDEAYSFPVFAAASNIPQQFTGSAIPRTYILNKKGEVVSAKSGMAKYNTSSFKDFLQELAKE